MTRILYAFIWGSFRARALTLMALLVASLLGTYAFWKAPQIIDQIIERQVAALESVLAASAEGLVPLIVAGDLGNVYDQLDVMQERLMNVSSIRLTDADDMLVYPLFEPDAPPVGTRTKMIDHEILIAGAFIAKLSVTLNMDVIAGPIRRDIINDSMTMAVVSILFACLFSFVLDAAVVKPMRHLKRAMDDTARGSDAVAKPTLRFGSRELDSLSRSFFAARAELRSTAQDLEVAKNEAVAARDAKTNFLANMSHELRTPLSGILGITELLLNRPQESANREMLEAVHGSGERLLTQLNSVLDLSRIEAGDMPVNSEEFDMGSILREAVALYTPKASEKGIELAWHTDLSGQTLRADQERLVQVLNNLISNAIKFTQKGGVTVSAKLAHQDDVPVLQVAVKDTGIGIDPEYLGLVFDKFEQVDDSITRRFGGSGLGLAVSRQIINFLGGEISVTSIKGKGATFELWIPVEQVEPISAEPKANTPASPFVRDVASGNLRVLIVDDEPINRLHAQMLLERLGVSEFAMAEDGAEAVSQFANSEFDIVYLDCHMPEMDGYETAQKLREYEAQSARPRAHIFGFTANIMPGTRERCLVAGMDDVLNKPLSLASFSNSLVAGTHGISLDDAAAWGDTARAN